MIGPFWTEEYIFALSLISHNCMSYALKGRIRWLNPPIFLCYFYSHRVYLQPLNGWYMEKKVKKSKNHCTLMGIYIVHIYFSALAIHVGMSRSFRESSSL
jgi:hypothetical protein